MLFESLDPKILGQRLQAERKARGLTQNDVASIIGVARTTIVAVEKGERLLQADEIMRLANEWQMPVSDLVRSRPIVEPLVPQLRAATPQSGLKPADVEGVSIAAEKIRHLGESYLELENLLGRPLLQTYPPAYAVSTMPVSDAAADIAQRERNRLGLGDGPISNLRAVLENDVGVRIFLLPLPSRIAGMFAFDAQLGGCIALNRAHPAGRRLWTLAHEFWHFLCDRYRADVYTLSGATPRRQSENERLADAFAAHFLMPAGGLRRRFYEIKASKSDGITPADLLHLARHYGVTFQALTLRLEELKLLRSGTWDMLNAAGFRVHEVKALSGLLPRDDQEERLPLRFLLLAAEAYDRAEISEGQLARLLDCDRLEARRIVQELSHTRFISDEGTAGELQIQLGQSLAEAA